MKKFTKINKKELKIVLIQGSPRSKDNCPDQDSKTEQIVKHIVKKYENDDYIKFDIVNLKIEPDKDLILPCKGCVSTAGGYSCHYKCDCYNKESKDKMYTENIYDKLEKCDAFVLLTPIHWSSVPSQVKTLFDRLVCINLTLTTEQAKELLNGDVKNAKKTKELSNSGEYDDLLINHWSGKTFAIYAHGDAGSTDYKNKKEPESYTKYCCELNAKDTILPIVWELRYSGINVPDELIEAFYINENKTYSKANDDFQKNDKEFTDRAEKLIEKLIKSIV